MITSPYQRFTTWLDGITGLVTMYRLVLICLLAVLVESVLVALTGALTYNPLAILAVAVVAVAMSYLSNRLFALIFRVRPHSESALVTGLILAFLYVPQFSGIQLLAVALAALFASASKYILAVRRRHVLNPAAAGAFIAGLVIPSNPATWWVASPWLLPLVIVAAFVILYRTRHLTMGVIAVVVAAGSAVVQQVSFGTLLQTAIPTALVSYPVIFFVGFMLSEPLTLPPRRWQQLVEAVVVGALFGVVLTLGPVTTSYLTALLIGNILAFLFGQRRGIRLTLLDRHELSSSSWELSFQPARSLRFEAGQYLELTLPHQGADVRGLRRTFSIASAPSSEIVSLGIRTSARSSSFKTALLRLKPGETVTATAVGGDFVLPRDAAKPVLLVAGGIGITPFVSHLAELATATATTAAGVVGAAGDGAGDLGAAGVVRAPAAAASAVGAPVAKRDVVLVYASSSSDDLAYADRLASADHRVLLVAPTPPASLPDHWTYLGAGPLTAELLTRAVPDAKARAAYVSGPPALVRSLKPALRRAGVRNVKSDYFSGY